MGSPSLPHCAAVRMAVFAGLKSGRKFVHSLLNSTSTSLLRECKRDNSKCIGVRNQTSVLIENSHATMVIATG